MSTDVRDRRGGTVTRELHIEPGNQETWKEGGQVRKSEPARLVYGRSGRTSFPECPRRVSGPRRATDPAGNERSLARATTANPLARSPSREHRNAGRIALSPADRRSISYEYRCPWRYMTGDRVVFSQKYVPDTRIRRRGGGGLLLLLLRSTGLSQNVAQTWNKGGIEISDVS